MRAVPAPSTNTDARAPPPSMRASRSVVIGLPGGAGVIRMLASAGRSKCALTVAPAGMVTEVRTTHAGSTTSRSPLSRASICATSSPQVGAQPTAKDAITRPPRARARADIVGRRRIACGSIRVVIGPSSPERGRSAGTSRAIGAPHDTARDRRSPAGIVGTVPWDRLTRGLRCAAARRRSRWSAARPRCRGARRPRARSPDRAPGSRRAMGSRPCPRRCLR